MPKYVVLLLCCLLSSSVLSETFEPYQVKAVYLLRFSKFMSWPDEEQLTEIRYCSLGKNQVTEVLSQLLPSQMVRKKPLIYKPLQSADQVIGCQMVYVVPERVPDLDPEQLDTGIVLVSDWRRYASRGGMLELRESGGRIKPVINLGRMKNAKVTIRSQLLRISTLISEKGE